MAEPRPTSLLPRLPRFLADLIPAFHHRSGSRTSISSVVEDVHGLERFRWILRNTLRGGLMVYLLYLVLFLALGLKLMVAVNVVCVLGYVVALRELRRGSVRVPFVVTALANMGHAIAATVVVGLSTGFFIHIPFVTVLAFLQPHVSRVGRSLWGAVTLVAFTGIIVFGELTTNLVRLPPLTDASLAIFNATAFVVSVGFLAYVAQEAAQGAERDLRIALARLDELARTDPLTGLLNRRAMSEQIEVEMRRVARTGRPFALLVVDLDDFKAINDEHGHAVGDHALRFVADRMLGSLRAQDQAARWGGEEFLLMLPETDLETALAVAERLRELVADPPMMVEDRPLCTTATFGVTVYQPGDTVHDAVRSADRALYQGKQGGKNRVVRSGA